MIREIRKNSCLFVLYKFVSLLLITQHYRVIFPADDDYFGIG